ncbi:unnamed protein product [Phytophthora lilii]|uniref:Unnamed protein product n=1 Tax=Phytophthora lilii TaxID=2077276 RepID=A0A9W7CQ10_9STRA|nr:unnamed protein product [Phytophthora lilii]
MNVVAQTDWSEKTARSRFESFMAAFRKAKRQPQLELPPIYRRLDALFGPDGYPESRLRSESLGQRSDSDLAPATGDEHAKSPPRRRPRTDTESTPTRTGPAESVSTVKAAAATAIAMLDAANAAAVKGEAANVAAVKGEAGNVVPNPTVKSEAADAAAVALESQRLAVRQLELELRQGELRARQEENRQKLRAEVLTRLVEAGKSPAEVREYLAIMDPVETPPPSRR